MKTIKKRTGNEQYQPTLQRGWADLMLTLYSFYMHLYKTYWKMFSGQHCIRRYEISTYTTEKQKPVCSYNPMQAMR